MCKAVKNLVGDALNVATLGATKSLFSRPKSPNAPAALAAPVAQSSRNPAAPMRTGGSQAAGGPVAGSSTSTLLTGPSGIDDNMLNLGKNTLLGG